MHRRNQPPYIMHSFKLNHEDADILKVQDWLDLHYTDSISFDDIAARFGFGVRNSIRRYKEATHQTSIKYLQSIRIEKAKYLLESTKANIETITYKVGYEDSNSFRRLFKDRVGVSPGEYRKNFNTKYCSSDIILIFILFEKLPVKLFTGLS